MNQLLTQKRHYLIVIIVFLQCSVYGKTIRISELSCNPADATSCLYNAISTADTVFIDVPDQIWHIRPLKFNRLKKRTIIFSRGVTLRAKPGSFLNVKDAMLEFVHSSEILVIGNGARVIMNKEEYTDGEWRHTISLRECRDVDIRDLTLMNSGGDGIYIAGVGNGTYSENISLNDITAINHKRQGISIISAQNVVVNRSVFTKTNGTLPSAGVDIEPNSEKDRIVDILFNKCTFSENEQSGVLLSLGKLTSNSLPVSIVFRECLLKNNHVSTGNYKASEIYASANTRIPVGGEVLFENCLIQDSQWGMFYSRKRADAYKIIFRDCAAINIAQNGKYPPIGFEVTDYKEASYLGNVVFDNVYIDYNPVLPLIIVRGSLSGGMKGFKAVNGKITVNRKVTEPISYINYMESGNESVDLQFIFQTSGRK